jgi:hypothetical protein
MKRDMDLVRELLKQAESQPPNVPLDLRSIAVSGYDHDTIRAHIDLLGQAGLVVTTSPPDGMAVVRSLTWQGHEFLEAVRNDQVWATTKRTIRSRGLDLTFDLVKGVASSVATSMMRSALGLTPG